MSWQATSYVLHQSDARLGDRLVLLVLADKANDDGSGAFPSVETIGHEARMSERAVRYSLRRLEVGGHIVPTGKSSSGTMTYSVVLGGAGSSGAKYAPGAINDTQGGQNPAGVVSDFAPEPPIEPTDEPPTTSTSSSEVRSVALDLFVYWQTTCNHPRAKPTRERLRAIKARLAEDYTPEDIRHAIDGAARHPFISEAGQRFDDLTLICRNGSKLEGFIERATVVAKSRPANGNGNGRTTMADYQALKGTLG